tara:strand:- start:62 stop:385 length:324 start_codon:yes stop_codon:yes gene_type:complete
MRLAMTLLEDLLPREFDIKEDILTQLDIKTNDFYPDGIAHCHYCNGEDIVCLEVLGAGEDPLFWLCQDCGELHLMKGPRKTKLLLKQAFGSFTNPKTWGYNSSEDYN